MCKNSNITALTRTGFTLIELQIYLAVIAVMAVMVCQVALMYQHLYDKTAIRAQQSIFLLAALRQADACCDQALQYQKKDGSFNPAIIFKNGKLMGLLNNRHTLLLEQVTSFSSDCDIRNKVVQGITLTCEYQGRIIRWYRAARTKAFSCSSSL